MLKLILCALAVVILALGATAFYVDTIAARALRSGAEAATGVPVSVGGTRVKLVAGRFQVRKLDVSNPKGYASPSFFILENLHFEVPPRALLGDPIEISQITIDGVELTLERKGIRTNAGVILANLAAAGQSGAAEPSAAPGPGVIIQTLVIRNARADLRLVPGKEVTVTLPEIRVEGLGRADGEVSSIAQVITTILMATIEGATGRAALPNSVAAELRRGLDSVRNGGLRGSTRTLLDEVERISGDGTRRVFKGVGRLLGGDD